jgi:PHP family Zn ribbon phosphoesterase
MDVLACPSCGQRYAVHNAGARGGWRCGNCSGDLDTVAQDVARISLLGPARPPARDDVRSRRTGDQAAFEEPV